MSVYFTDCDINLAHLGAIVFNDLLTGCHDNSDNDVVAMGPVATHISTVSIV